MKKVLYFVFAALALVACEPNNGATEKVRIGVSLDDNTQPAKGPQRISAVDGVDEIVVNWEEGDKLYYAVGEENPGDNAPFEIISGWDSPSAFFECAQFNLDNLDKNMNWYYNGCANFVNPFELNQSITIVKNKTVINHDYLLYTAKNQKIGTFHLQPAFKLVGVALTGTTAQTIHIVIGPSTEHSKGYQGDWSQIYTCCLVGANGLPQNVQLDSTVPTTFYLVLPSDYNFEGKSVWLAYDRGHNISTKIELDAIQQISQDYFGEALMLNINVTDWTSDSWDKLQLNPVPSK